MMADPYSMTVLRRMARERGVRVDYQQGTAPYAVRHRAGAPALAAFRDREGARDFLHTLPKKAQVRY
jgi:hypothetical protein